MILVKIYAIILTKKSKMNAKYQQKLRTLSKIQYNINPKTSKKILYNFKIHYDSDKK